MFARFTVVYGVQKTSGMWGASGSEEEQRRAMDEIVGVWAQALARFDRTAIADAVQELPNQPWTWPPTLPEFVDLCERFQHRPGRNLALPVPARTPEEIAAGAEQMRKIRSMLGGSLRRMP